MGNFLRDPSDGRLLTVLSNIFVFPLCTPNLCDNIHFPEFSTVRPVVRLDQDFSNNKYYPVSWKFFILMVAKLYLSILLNRLESSTFSNGLNRDRSVHRKCYLLLESRPTFGLRLLCYLILVPLNRKRSESIPAWVWRSQTRVSFLKIRRARAWSANRDANIENTCRTSAGKRNLCQIFTVGPSLSRGFMITYPRRSSRMRWEEDV